MKYVKSFLSESTQNKNKVTILIEGVDFQDNDDYISVFEILDNIKGINAELVSKTKNMISVFTDIDVYEDINSFSDLVLEQLRNKGMKVKIIKLN